MMMIKVITKMYSPGQLRFMWGEFLNFRSKFRSTRSDKYQDNVKIRQYYAAAAFIKDGLFSKIFQSGSSSV